jgi:membrane protein insertase Oxa1/YidC/SpoIIIJ
MGLMLLLNNHLGSIVLFLKWILILDLLGEYWTYWMILAILAEYWTYWVNTRPNG